METKSAGRPSPFVMDRAIRRSALSDYQVRLLLEIVDHAGHGQSACTASYQTLADETNSQRRSVIRAVGRFKREGWITLERAAAKTGVTTIRIGPRLLEDTKRQPEKAHGRRKRHPKKNSASDSRVTSASDSRVTSASDSRVTQTSPLLSGETSPSNGGARRGDVSPPQKEESPRIPGEILEAIEKVLGAEVASEAARSARQVHHACGGDWMALTAAAHRAGSAKGVRNPFAMLMAKAKDFAANGIPPEAKPKPKEPESIVVGTREWHAQEWGQKRAEAAVHDGRISRLQSYEESRRLAAEYLASANYEHEAWFWATRKAEKDLFAGRLASGCFLGEVDRLTAEYLARRHGQAGIRPSSPDPASAAMTGETT